MISNQFLISIRPINYNTLFMKIIRIFGIVVGIHLILGLILAGCSSAGRPVAAAQPPTQPKAADSAPAVGMPSLAAAPSANTPAAPLFHPIGPSDAPTAPSGPVIFYSPTRPGTPAASAVEAQPAGDVTPATTYTVGQGDSWWTIAKKSHLKISELAAANNLRSTSTLHPGQKLLIPAKGISQGAASGATEPAASPAPAHTGAPAGGGRHVVKRGETLGSIAHAYGLKIGDLAAANSISDPGKIRPGQELTIPAGGHAPRPAKARAAAPVNEETPAATPALDNSALPPPATDAGPGAPSGPGADVPVIKIEPSSQPAPANPPK